MILLQITLWITGIVYYVDSFCLWYECTLSYTEFTPRLPQGKCGIQFRKARHHYKIHSKASGSCPPTNICKGNDRSRYMCKNVLFLFNFFFHEVLGCYRYIK